MKTDDYEYTSKAHTMTERDWEEVDRSSRDTLSCLLIYLGAEDIGETHGNCCLDLSCVMSGKRVAVEIKDRNIPHDRWGDILVEDLKQECNQRRVDKGQFDTTLAVNVYIDKVIAMASMFDKDARHSAKYAPCTTLVKGGDHTRILKHFCNLPQRRKWKFERFGEVYKFSKID